MTYHLPQLIEDQFHLLFAAAIWILDNAEDEVLLRTQQDEFARAIARGITDFEQETLNR